MIDSSKVLTVARYTFLEVAKSKVFFNVFLIGLGLVLITYIGSEFTYGVPDRIALDLGLGALSLSSVMIAVFMGVNLLSKEVENRTIYMVISRPISRHDFLLGRVLGMSAILISNILLLGLMSVSIFLYLGGEFQGLILWAMLMTVFESLLCLGIVTCFSLFTNSIMSILYTLSLYAMGHVVSELLGTRVVKSNIVFNSLLNIYNSVFPNFSRLNLKNFVLFEKDLSLTFLSSNILYALTYFLALLLISSFIFRSKNLD